MRIYFQYSHVRWKSIGNKVLYGLCCFALLHGMTSCEEGLDDTEIRKPNGSLAKQEELSAGLSTIFTSSPKAFLIYHPALTYFAEDYGWTQISIETDGKEPSPAQLARIIQACKEKQVRTIFVQQEFDRKNAELIAKETGTRIATINPLSYDWTGELLKIAHTLHDQ